MKRFTQVALALSIIMMCASPNEVWGQNRRTSNSGQSKTEQRSSSSSSRTSSQRSTSITKSNDNKAKSASQTRSSSATRSSSTKLSSSSNTPQVRDYRNTTTSRSSRTVTTTPSRTTDKNATRTVTPSRTNGNNATRTVTTTPSRTTDKNATRTVTTTPSRTNGNNATRTVTTTPSRTTDKNATRTVTTTPSRTNGNNATRTVTTTPNRATDKNMSRNGRDNINGPINESKPNALQYHSSAPAPRKNWERPYLQEHHKPAPPHRYGDHNFGYRCNYLPHGARMRMHNNIRYYFYDGIYYRPYYLGGYVVCRPPFGTYYSNTLLNIALTAAVINAYRNAAERAERAAALARAYSYYDNQYKVRSIDDYVTNVANQNDQYYYQDGVFYTLSNGQYYVIEPPVGALITQLPDDYEEVDLDGDTYYQVENALYKVTVIDGALYFEVVCAL